MKLSVFLLLILFIAGQISGKNTKKGLSVITPELLRQHIDFLASDSLKGRNTPSPELELAADYIAKEFAALGIRPVQNSWFQPVPIISRNLDIDRCQLAITLGDQKKNFRLKTDYNPFEMTADTVVASSLVFAGYGITAPEYQYDDYDGVDVRGKIVLIMKHEPGEKDTASCFNGIRETRHSQTSVKLENAMKHGAIGLMIVTDPLNHMLLNPQGHPWPALSSFMTQDNLPVEMKDGKRTIPCIQVGETVVKALFGSVDSLRSIQKSIDQSLKPRSFEVPASGCLLQTALKITRYPVNNVIGILEGSDPVLKNEFVVIGGHYDHVGVQKVQRQGEDNIFNGADDNASGTAGVLAVAKAFSAMNKRPARSVVFILFAGEEKGLFGSQHYCDHPVVPLDKSVVMLNLDMISRNGADTLQLDGLAYNPDLASILMSEARKLNLRNYPGEEDLFKRSDHYNFYRKGVSAINITSGLHSDYHTVRDNPDSVDPAKAALISRLIFKTAWKIAGEPIYLKTVPIR